MSDSKSAFWTCIICATVWAAADGLIGATIWFVAAVVYGIIAAKEDNQ